MSDHSFKQSFRLYLRLLKYSGAYPLRVQLTVLMMGLTAASTALVMYQLKPILDNTFTKTDNPAATFHTLVYVTIPITLLAALVRAAAGYGQGYLSGFLGQRVIQDLRNDLYSHFLILPMSYFNSQRTGSLAARITNDVQVLQDSIANIVARGTSSILTSIALIFVMFYLDWQLAFAALVVFPLALFPIYRFGRRVRHSSGEGQQILADLNSQIHETLAGIRVVKAFGAEKHEIKKFEETNDKFFAVTMRSIRAFSASSPIVEVIATVALLLLIIWLAHRVFFENNMTIGVFGSFVVATATLYPQLKNFNGLWSGLQHALASAERCFQVLDIPNSMADEPGAVEVKTLQKRLEFKNVSFEYVPGHPVLRDVSFAVKRGEVVALVGPSGGGKSTLADLVPRFYTPTQGAIFWDGIDLKQTRLVSLRSHIGLVTQETILFHDSILGNIAYGKPGASFPRVMEAAQAAYAKEFVENTPRGFNTQIGDRGVKLSGGQRQRLAIARAILKNPPLLILDEATSALDTQSEQLVQKALDRLMGDRTTLVIAHRLSTIRKAHRILVIDKGRIVEQGKHGALLKKRGLYAKLYKMQFRTSSDFRTHDPA
jgi:subfamily B ATP-binding cassette protein MsbA